MASKPLGLSPKLSAIWQRNPHVYHIASSLVLARNLQAFYFPPKLDRHSQSKLFEFLKAEVKRALPSAQIFEGQELRGEDKAWISEHFLLREGINHLQQAQGIAMDRSSKFLLRINDQDHLNFHVSQPGDNLQSAFEKVFRIERSLGKKMEWAFSERYGFLTTRPEQCGSALVCSSLLHIPLTLEEGAFRIESKLKLTSIDHQRAPKEQSDSFFPGGFVWIENRQTLGISEEEILSSLTQQNTKLLGRERRLREEKRQNLDDATKNQISRSFGLMKHSWTLGSKELLEAIAMLKLGLDLGVVTGCTQKNLNQILLASGRGALEAQSPGEESLEHRRGAFVQKILKRLRLNL